jgi:predicted nuclease of predicted toxin-antitoxin system
VRLLLDEMFPAAIARQLREKHRFDVVAVSEDESLSGQPDEEVFAAAQRAERTIVTENVPDFRRLARQWEAAGGIHHGVIYTTNRKFPRHRPQTIGRLVRALSDLLRSAPDPASPSNLEVWL